MWYEHFTDKKFLSMIYINIPPLHDVRIERIEISCEGDRISIGFDMPYYADNPPKKWVEKGYTTTFVESDFFDIQEISLISNKNTYRGNIDIEQDDDRSIFIIKISGSVEAEIKAASCIIQSVSGF